MGMEVSPCGTDRGCADCGKPLASPDEMESGLCLLCLNGPVSR